MSVNRQARHHVGLPVLRLLPTFWGLAVILGLAGYSFAETLTYEAPLRATETRRLLPRPAVAGGALFYPVAPAEPMVVHLACNQEDARQARTYDPPATGRAHILRLDQSAEEMQSVFHGVNPLYPTEVRLVTTACIQGMIDAGTFP